jgi:hypothetical protein
MKEMDFVEIKDEILKWGKKKYPKKIFSESSIALTLVWLDDNNAFTYKKDIVKPQQTQGEK